MGVDRPEGSARRIPSVGVGDRPPPLGVGHLLLWMACCGLCLAWLRRTLPASPDWRQLVLVLFHVLGHGAAIAGLGMIVLRRVRRRRWLVEPGLGLLSVLGALALTRIGLALLPRPLFHNNEVVLAALACCLLLLPALARKTPAAWRTAFCLLAVVFAAPLLANVVATITGAASAPLLTLGREIARWRFVLYLMILAGAAGVDFRPSKQRTWAHWVGVVDFLWIVALPPAGTDF